MFTFRIFISRFFITLTSLMFLISAVYANSCPGKREFKGTKVIGGERSKIKNWPGLVVLRLTDRVKGDIIYWCGGTMVNDRWVLTAAHCFDRLFKKAEDTYIDADGWELEIVRGKTSLKQVSENDVAQIEKVIIHNEYKPKRAHLDGHDIALIKIKANWSGPSIPLGLGVDINAIGQNLKVAGYGATSVGSDNYGVTEEFQDERGKTFLAGSDRLMDLQIPYVPINICKKRYRGKAIGSGQICSGLDSDGHDACQGDSGGPLVSYDNNGCPFQVGIVSWGEGCAKGGNYGVYTRVAHYADWIKRHAGRLNAYKDSNALGEDKVKRFEFFERVEFQLKNMIRGRGAKLNLNIRGGNRIPLGAEVAFEARSGISGKLIIIDVNANGKATQIFPNKFVLDPDLWNIQQGIPVFIPNQKHYNQRAFRAVPPAGKGYLLGIVVPEDFQLWATKAGQDIRSKGFQPIGRQENFLQDFVARVREYITSRKRVNRNSSGRRRALWAITVTEYEFTK